MNIHRTKKLLQEVFAGASPWEIIRILCGLLYAATSVFILAPILLGVGLIREHVKEEVHTPSYWGVGWIPRAWHGTVYWITFVLFFGVRTVLIGRPPRAHTDNHILFVPSYHTSELGFIPYYRLLEHYLSPNLLLSFKRSGMKGIVRLLMARTNEVLGRLLWVDRRKEKREQTLEELRKGIKERDGLNLSFSLFLNSRPTHKLTVLDKVKLLADGPLTNPEGEEDHLHWLIVPFPKAGGFINALNALPKGRRMVMVFSSFNVHVANPLHIRKLLGAEFVAQMIEFSPEEADALHRQDDEDQAVYNARIKRTLLYDYWRPWCHKLAEMWDANDPGWRG